MMIRLPFEKMRRPILLAAMVTIAAPAVAHAQVTQSIGFSAGYFALKAQDSRVGGDVLVADLTNSQPLLFLIKDFNGGTFGGEWLLGFGKFVDAGVGLGYYQRTVPSVYAFLQGPGQTEISQELKLRVIPVTFSVRLLPMGRKGLVEPYIGAGVVAMRYHYSEIGNFVDNFSNIFPGSYVANGTAVGPVFLGGVNFPIGDMFQFGGEAKYQKVDAAIAGAVNIGFLGDHLDLGGWTGNVTVHFRF